MKAFLREYYKNHKKTWTQAQSIAHHTKVKADLVALHAFWVHGKKAQWSTRIPTSISDINAMMADMEERKRRAAELAAQRAEKAAAKKKSEEGHP